MKKYIFWTWIGSGGIYAAQHFWTLCQTDRGWKKKRRTGRQKKPQERLRTFCARVLLVWAAVWTPSHVHTIKYSSQGLSLLFCWGFFPLSFIGSARLRVPHTVLWTVLCGSLGLHWKGNRGPSETVGGDVHSVRDNKEEQWETKPQQDSQPPANKTVHQGKMFVQILIMYYSPETIFICSPAIHRGMHCLALL